MRRLDALPLTTSRPELSLQTSVHVKTYRDVLEEYRAHAETKSLAPDGTLCVGATDGTAAASVQ